MTEDILKKGTDFLTIEEVSNQLRCNRALVSKLIFTKKLKAYRISRKYLISRDSFREYLEKNEVK